MDMDTDLNAKYAHNGKVLLGSAILLFLFLILIVFVHTYAYSCFRRRYPQRHRRHNRHLSPHQSTTTPTVHHKGLDPSLFNILPTFTYSSATHRHPQECAVCLSEFEEDDEGRILPNCNHGFHTHCIDTWFRSHSNCPICRVPVQPPKASPQRTEVCVSNGELAGCSYLPPPIGCPRKGLDLELVSVTIDGSREELEERLRSSESGSAGHTGLKSSDEQILILKKIWRSRVVDFTSGAQPAQPAQERR